MKLRLIINEDYKSPTECNLTDKEDILDDVLSIFYDEDNTGDDANPRVVIKDLKALMKSLYNLEGIEYIEELEDVNLPT